MFEDIRPFRNHEVVSVIDELVNEEEFKSSIAQFALPKLQKYFPRFSSFLVTQYLKYKQSHFVSIEKIQLEVCKYLSRLINKSTDGFSYSGLEHIDKNKPALFISNHRDIVLDVALVNLALHKNGINTVEAAVGDNLLSKKWISDLMRINKSFIVKRNEETKRAMLNASKTLSAYIHQTLSQDKNNMWIAQREGRAKDGLDKTNPALISMLLMNKAKEQSINEYLQDLNIIPVAISYEYDPCDTDKAIELAVKEQTGSYEKEDDEDIKSISQGMMGYKGKIHIAFCQPIKGELNSSKVIAQEIDKQIITHYRLYQSNKVAHAKLNNQPYDQEEFGRLEARMKGLSSQEQQWLLTMYANPVTALWALNNK